MAEVFLLHTSEDDQVRTYSVDEVVEGRSGIVTATRTPNANSPWAFDTTQQPELEGADRNACIEALREHLTAEALAEVEAAELAASRPGAAAPAEEPPAGQTGDETAI